VIYSSQDALPGLGSLISPPSSRRIYGKVAYIKQQKSDNWVVIPLRDAAREILIHTFNKEIPTVSNPKFNQHIKEEYIRIIPEEAGLKLFLIFASSKFLSLWNQSKNQSLKKR
jgi:hypothetical protein